MYEQGSDMQNSEKSCSIWIKSNMNSWAEFQYNATNPKRKKSFNHQNCRINELQH